MLQELVKEILYSELHRLLKVKMILFIINTILISLILFFLVKGLSNFYKKHYNDLALSFFALFSLYFSLFILSFCWIFKIIRFNPNSFLFIYAIFIFLQTLTFFFIAYGILKNKKIFLLLLLYLFIALSFIFNFYFFHFLIILSFFLIIMVFLGFLYFKENRQIGYFAIFYALTSLILQLIVLLNKNFLYPSSIFSNFIFLFFISKFLRVAKKPHEFFHKIKEGYYLLDFLKYFIFLIALINFLFIGTISVHEIGHLVASKIYHCEYGRIVYESGLPRTELLCQNEENKGLVILGGILLPIILAFLLFFGGGKFIKESSLVILGFNLIISQRDYLDLNLDQNIVLFILILGISCVILGIALLAKSRTEERFYQLI